MNQIMQINNEGGELPQALLPSGALSLELRSAPSEGERATLLNPLHA